VILFVGPVVYLSPIPEPDNGPSCMNGQAQIGLQEILTIEMAGTGMKIDVRELLKEEFRLAEKLWQEYRGQKNDMPEERVFAVFENGSLAATARCTRHPDGLEMDCVFAGERFRGKGYARLAVQALIDACGKEQIYIHSTLALISFYKTFGFVPLHEDLLPKTIKERFLFCFGEMEGCNVCPMTRVGSG